MALPEIDESEHKGTLKVYPDKVYLSVVVHKPAGTLQSALLSRVSVGKAQAAKQVELGASLRLGYSLFSTTDALMQVGSVGIRDDELEGVLYRDIVGKLLAEKELAGVVCLREQSSMIKAALRPYLSQSVSSAASRSASMATAGESADDAAIEPMAVLQSVPGTQGRPDDNAAIILGTVFENILHSLGDDPTRQEYRIAVAAVIDFVDPAVVVSAGLLIGYLKKLRVVRSSFSSESSMPSADRGVCTIGSLYALRLSEFTYIDKATMAALQVFSSDEHPSVVRGKGRSKEGVSMYSLFSQKLSRSDSRARLREMLRYPSCNLATISIRHQAVQELVDALNVCPEALQRLQKWMSPTSALVPIASNFRKYDHSPSYWVRLRKATSAVLATLEGLRAVLAHLGQAGGESDPVESQDATSRYLHNVLQDIEDGKDTVNLDKRLSEVIDWDRTAVSDRVCIAAGVSGELDALLNVQDYMPSKLEAVGASIRKAVGNHLGAFEVEALPQLGCLVAVPRTSIPDSPHDRAQALKGFTFVLEDEDSVYFRHSLTEAVDESIGDIHQKIQDVEDEVLRSLQLEVYGTFEDLHFLASVLADLDVMLAFASLAVDFNFIRPELSEEPVTRLSGCWHPIIEFLHESAIPNDSVLGGDEPSVGVVTGPNASGKSVYMKTVALSQYLAQVGSFVPAAHATVGLASSIVACISPAESATSGLSSFYHELVDIGKALSLSNENAFVIIDEFGRGTNSTDGAALFASLVRHFVLRAPGARVLLATHFTEVIHSDILGVRVLAESEDSGEDVDSALPSSGAGDDRNTQAARTRGGVASFKMQVQFADDHGSSLAVGKKRPREEASGAEVIPLFKLYRGISDGSFGVYCATKAGVPEAVCSRAAEAVEAVKVKVSIRKAR